jgi:hypothetical protein
MVQLNKEKKDYAVRVASAGANQKLFVSGVLSYSGGTYTGGSHKNTTTMPYIDYGGTNTTADVTFLDDSTLVPFPPVHPAQQADQTVKLLLNRTGAAYQWTLANDMPFNLSLEDIEPLLFNPYQLGNTSLVISTKNGTWVDLIYIATNSGGIQPPHPIHKHSNKAHIIVSLALYVSGFSAPPIDNMCSGFWKWRIYLGECRRSDQRHSGQFQS